MIVVLALGVCLYAATSRQLLNLQGRITDNQGAGSQVTWMRFQDREKLIWVRHRCDTSLKKPLFLGTLQI